MGFIIFLAIVIGIPWAIGHHKTKQEEEARRTGAGRSQNKPPELQPLGVKLVSETLTLDDGTEIKVLSVKVRGVVDSDNRLVENDSAGFCVRMYSTDDDDSKEMPVVCSIEDFQLEDYPFFYHETDSFNAYHGLFGGWKDWVRLVSVPVDSLTFARTGLLTVHVELLAEYSIAGDTVSRKVDLTYFNPQKGYIDSADDRKRAKEVAVSLAVLVSGIDGSHDNHEAEIVKGFIKKQITELSGEEEKNRTKKSLNDAVIKTHSIKDVSIIKRSGMALAREAKDFEPSHKFMIMELLLDVAGADGVAEGAETEFLNALAHTMGMDVEEYKNMRDKALPITMYAENTAGDSGQIEDMLGITSSMTPAEKKSQLNKEFRKWNALQNSSDPEKSSQAKKMVRAISELRKQL